MSVRESSTDDQTVFALSDRFVEQLAAHQPMLATQMGVAGHDAEWGKHDPESWQDLGVLIRRTRSALSQLPPGTGNGSAGVSWTTTLGWGWNASTERSPSAT